MSNTILQIASECIPNKVVTIRVNDKPWVKREIKRMIRKRRRLHDKAKKTNSVVHWASFRQIRNKCVTAIRKAKKEYIDKLANDLRDNILPSKSWWRIAKMFMDNNKKNTIPALLYNNKLYDDDDHKVNILNEYFCNQSIIDDSNIDIPDSDKPNIKFDRLIMFDKLCPL